MCKAAKRTAVSPTVPETEGHSKLFFRKSTYLHIWASFNADKLRANGP